MMTNTADLLYETPVPPRAPRIWAATVITLAGLGLVVLGGCFMIGVMIVTQQSLFAGMATPAVARPDWVFVGVLYSLAGLCFLGALLLLVHGVRMLTAIARSQ